MLPINKP